MKKRITFIAAALATVAFSLMLASSAETAAAPSAIDLGTLGGSSSVALAVSPSGQVVGYSASQLTPPFTRSPGRAWAGWLISAPWAAATARLLR